MFLICYQNLVVYLLGGALGFEERERKDFWEEDRRVGKGRRNLRMREVKCGKEKETISDFPQGNSITNSVLPSGLVLGVFMKHLAVMATTRHRMRPLLTPPSGIG